MTERTPLPAHQVVALLGGPAFVARTILLGRITPQAVVQWNTVPGCHAPRLEAYARANQITLPGGRPLLCEDMVPATEWQLIRNTAAVCLTDDEII